MTKQHEYVPSNWLDGPISLVEAEAENTHFGIPFGCQNEQWLNIKSQMVLGDELWCFTSPYESWQQHAGQSGITLVRNGKTIDGLVTMRN